MKLPGRAWKLVMLMILLQGIAWAAVYYALRPAPPVAVPTQIQRYEAQVDSLRQRSARLSYEKTLLRSALDSVRKHRENEISRMDSLHIDSVLRLLAAD